MKVVNPLFYPLPILASMVTLVLGVRIARLSEVIVIPVAGAVAFAGASLQRSRQPIRWDLDDPELERELREAKQQAQALAEKAESLKTEATATLTEVDHIELLVAVQRACDRIQQLPTQVDQMALSMQGADSVLSVADLQAQLDQSRARLQVGSGATQQQLIRLTESLERNIQLAQQGEDARRAQVASLSTQILDAAGLLQELQNQLRTSKLTQVSDHLPAMQQLSEELQAFQANMDLLLVTPRQGST